MNDNINNCKILYNVNLFEKPKMLALRDFGFNEWGNILSYYASDRYTNTNGTLLEDIAFKVLRLACIYDQKTPEIFYKQVIKIADSLGFSEQNAIKTFADIINRADFGKADFDIELLTDATISALLAIQRKHAEKEKAFNKMQAQKRAESIRGIYSMVFNKKPTADSAKNRRVTILAFSPSVNDLDFS